MKMRQLVVLIGVALALGPASVLAGPNNEPAPFVYVPPEGFVPDADTAIKVSEVIVGRIVGEELDMEKPLRAMLVDGVWVVKGTMPRGLLGGTAEIHIRKADGAILFYRHGA